VITALLAALALGAATAAAASTAPATPPAARPATSPPAAGAPARKLAPARLAVLDVVLTGRDSAGLDAAALTELFGAAVEDAEVFRATTTRDLSAMLGLEKMKQMAGCTEDTSCLAEIAGSLGVEYLASASIGSLEGRLVVSGRLVDTRRAAVMSRSSETVASRAEVPEALQRVGHRLRNAFRASRGMAPSAAATAATSRLEWGAWLGGAAAPTEKTVGGEALLTLDAGAWEFGAGLTIASKPAARLAVSRALGGQALSFRLGLKAVAGSAQGGAVLGGGPAAWLRWRVAGWLDADLVGSAEYLKAPSGAKMVPVVGLGLHGHTPP
jgi:hypothetical protein